MCRLLWSLGLCVIFGTSLKSQCTDLFFSEYIEGSSNNKCLEIYNPTGLPIMDLSTYTVEFYFNGDGLIDGPGNTITLSGMLAADDVHVLCDDGTDFMGLGITADQQAPGSFYNGDDAIVLRNGTSIIDVIGQIGFDPGSEWGGVTQNNTIVRNADVACGDSDGSNVFDPSLEWTSFPQDVVDGLGAHTYAGGGGGPIMNLCSFDEPDSTGFGAMLVTCEGQPIIIDLSSQANSDIGNLLLVEGFGTSDNYTTSIPETMDNRDNFSVYDINSLPGGYEVTPLSLSLPVSDDNIFIAEDIDGLPGSPSSMQTLDITGVNIAGEANLRFFVSLGEDDDGMNQDWDADEYVHFQVQIDGGGYQTILAIESAGTGTNDEPRVDTNMDGIGDGQEVTSDMQQFVAPIAGTGNSLDVRVVFNLNAGDEDIAIDNILIVSYPSAQTAFNFYEENPDVNAVNPIVANDVSINYTPVLDEDTDTVWVTTTDLSCETPATPFVITLNANPAVVATAPQTCLGDDLMLMEEGGEATDWMWTGPNNFMSTDQNPTITGVTLAESGTYQVIGSNGTCSDSATVMVALADLSVEPVAPLVAACDVSEAIITPEEYPIEVTTEALGLFFSEYIEGSGNNKCLEIYNGTGADVDLSDYEVILYSNGNTSPNSTESLSGTLSNGSTYVICNGTAEPGFLALADLTSGVANFNGDDAITLELNGSVIDAFGQVGFDPGSRWSENGVETQNMTLIRNLDISEGDSDETDAFDPSAEWTALPSIDDISNLGSHNYNGTTIINAGFNFYSDDPAMHMGLVPLAEDVASYDVGGEDTIFVTATYQGCESPAIAVPVLVSTGLPAQLSCEGRVNISLTHACDFFDDPALFIIGESPIEFLEVILKDEDGNEIESLGPEYLGRELIYEVGDRCTPASCWGTVWLEDKNPPTIEIEDITVDCGESIAEEDLDPVMITDCSEYFYSTVDIVSGEYCDDNRQIERKFTAKDIFGNAATVSQIITIDRRSLDDITPPTDYVVTDCGVYTPADIFDFTGNLEDAYPTIDGNMVTKGEFCNFGVWVDETIIPACGEDCDSYKVTRIWNAIDWCTSVIEEFDQIIAAKDQTDPEITDDRTVVKYYADPWECKATFTLPMLEMSDNCTGPLTQVVDGPEGIIINGNVATHVPIDTHTFTYYAEDCCGNRSDAYPLTVIVIDTISPIAITKERIVASLGSPFLTDRGRIDAVAVIKAESFDNNSWDNCGPVSILVAECGGLDDCAPDLDDYEPEIVFECRDVNKEHMVSLLVTDQYGNTAISWSIVTIEDKAVTIECTPLLLQCHDDIDDAIKDRDNQPVALNSCGRTQRLVEVARDYTEYNDVCNFGTIYVTYAVRDYPEITCTQEVIVDYKGDFDCSNVDWPAEVTTTDCMDKVPLELDITPGPCELIGWAVDVDTFEYSDDACAKIIREYTVIDWCIYDAVRAENNGAVPNLEGGKNCNANNRIGMVPGVFNYTEIIKIVDDVVPQLLNCAYDPTFITTDCETDVIISNIAIDNSDCPNQVLSWTLVVTTEDGRVFEYENKTKPSETWVVELTGIGFPGPRSTHTAFWKVSDGCGNTDVCESTFTVIDGKDPTPYCIDLSSAIMENGNLEIWAIDFNLNSSDNCTDSMDLIYTFDEIAPDPDYLDEEHYFNEDGIILPEEAGLEAYLNSEAQLWIPSRRSSAFNFTCSYIGDNLLKMTVWDEEGNHDFCTVEFGISDGTNTCGERGMIAGDIFTERGIAIPSVEVETTQLGAENQNTSMSNNSGHYELMGNLQDASYIVSPTKEGNYLNGITSEDAIYLREAILNATLFQSPYQVLAGDVNNDQRLTASDIISIQKLIVGSITEFDSPVWKFVDAEQEVDIATILEDYADYRRVIELKHADMGNDFIGVKIGDLNYDATFNGSRSNIQPRNNQVITLTTDDQPLSSGEIVSFQVSLDQDVRGLLLSLDNSGLSFQNILVDGTSIVYHENETSTLISIIGDLDESHKITFEAIAKRNGMLSDLLILTDGVELSNTAYQKNGIANVEFNLISDELNDLVLLQNQPNPFTELTQLSFNLPIDSKVKWTFFQADGKVLRIMNREYPAGKNTLQLRGEDLGGASGLIIVRMEVNDQVLTKRMLRLGS